MTQQLGLVLTHMPTDSRLHTALRLVQAWQRCEAGVFGLFLQGDAVSLAQPRRGSIAKPAQALLEFCQQHSIAVNACVGSCQQRELCDTRGKPVSADWDTRVSVAGLGELAAMLGECTRVITL